jgi:hypothetical protein
MTCRSRRRGLIVTHCVRRPLGRGGVPDHRLPPIGEAEAGSIEGGDHVSRRNSHTRPGEIDLERLAKINSGLDPRQAVRPTGVR